MEFYQLKIIRKGTKPPVWRRCLVPSNITFAQMAAVLEEIADLEAQTTKLDTLRAEAEELKNRLTAKQA